MQIRDNYTPDGKILPLPHNHMCRHELALPEKENIVGKRENVSNMQFSLYHNFFYHSEKSTSFHHFIHM